MISSVARAAEACRPGATKKRSRCARTGCRCIRKVCGQPWQVRRADRRAGTQVDDYNRYLVSHVPPDCEDRGYPAAGG